MDLPLFRVDAFAAKPFGGNPAAVCVLSGEQPAAWMQQVAAEKALSETAFLHRIDGAWELRWFTPTAEVDLCGHATLAAAHVLWSEGFADRTDALAFDTASGRLTARADGDAIALDFPADPPGTADEPEGLADALGAAIRWYGRSSDDHVAVLDSPDTVRALTPDIDALAAFGGQGVIVTARAPDGDIDVVSRYFAPNVGIPEDPVTGAAHCTIGPYWFEQLATDRLVAEQASARGGMLEVRARGARVELLGRAVTVFRGSLTA